MAEYRRPVEADDQDRNRNERTDLPEPDGDLAARRESGAADRLYSRAGSS